MTASPSPSAGRGGWWRGPTAAVTIGVLWLVLVAWRPGTTFHLAPALVTASWAVTARWTTGGVALRYGHAAWCVTGGVLVAAAVTAGLVVSGRLNGPDLLGGSHAPAETVLMVAAAAPIIWWVVTRTRRARRG